jgi:hypothetical protein
MALIDVRQQLETWWSTFDARALSEKDSQAVTIELIRRYGQLSPAERTIADPVIGEWVRSHEERKRFDALAVIDHYRVRSAVPQLHALECDLLRSKAPGAPFELKKVRQVLDRLENE